MIELRPFTENDFDQLVNWIDTPELLANWAGSLFSFPLTRDSMSWYIKNTNKPNDDVFVYKAIETDSEQTVGHISLGSISKKNRSGRISRVFICNEAKGKGYCSQMVTAILQIGFEDLKLHRICLGVYDFNVSAIACYKKAGFVIEGTNRDVLWNNDSYWSLVEMSMLESEWFGKRNDM
jgi:RimJ/RimL family protein N-acetyltransferase